MHGEAPSHAFMKSPNLPGYRWEGTACLVSFTAAALLLYFCSVSPYFAGASLVAVLILSILVLLLLLLGTCFGVSYMRTWRRVYRDVMLAVLVIAAIAFYLSIVLPEK